MASIVEILRGLFDPPQRGSGFRTFNEGDIPSGQGGFSPRGSGDFSQFTPRNRTVGSGDFSQFTPGRDRAQPLDFGTLAPGTFAVGSHGVPPRPPRRIPSTTTTQSETARRQTIGADAVGPAAPSGFTLPAQPEAGAGGAGSDPYAGLFGELESAYDSMIDAVLASGGTLEDLARQTQGDIEGFFNQAQGRVGGARQAAGATFDQSSQALDALFDQVTGNIAEIPGDALSIAAEAAGAKLGPEAAQELAAALAPIQATAEVDRGASMANLQAHRSAGQDFLSNLSANLGGEQALQQSQTSRLSQAQQAALSLRKADIESQKQLAILDLKADIAGTAAEQAGKAAGLLVSDDPQEQLLFASFTEGNQDKIIFAMANGMTFPQAVASLAKGGDGASAMSPQQIAALQLVAEEQGGDPNLVPIALQGGLTENQALSASRPDPFRRLEQSVSSLPPSQSSVLDKVREIVETSLGRDGGLDVDVRGLSDQQFAQELIRALPKAVREAGNLDPKIVKNMSDEEIAAIPGVAELFLRPLEQFIRRTFGI